MAMTLEQAQQKRRTQIEQNEDIGVIDWTSDEKQSDEVWEVTEGYTHLPDGEGGWKTLGPGNRFHPTVHQVEKDKLKGKARPLTATEMAGISRSKDPRRKVSVRGADIGIRDTDRYPMAPTTLRTALGGGLTEEDFRGVEPEGSDGRYLLEQIERMVEAKSSDLPPAA